MVGDLSRYLDALAKHVVTGVPEGAKGWATTVAEGLLAASQELQSASQQLLAMKSEADAERVRYQELFDFASHGYLISTARGRILEANRAAAELLGVPSPYLVGKPLGLYVYPDDRITFLSILHEMSQRDVAEWTLRLTPRQRPQIIASVRVGSVRPEIDRVIGLRWLIRDVTREKRAEQELTASREQLRSLASEVSRVEERERRRIATQLHDNIGQLLATAKMKLGAVHSGADPDTKAALGEVQKLLEDTIGQTRTLTFDVSPPVLYELGLPAALDWLGERVQKQFGLRVKVRDDGEPKPLEDDVRSLLFEAVRELLFNVIKHASVNKACVTSRRLGSEIELTVLDEGIGFQKQNPPDSTGFGLFSIRMRLENMGGHVQVISKPGHGTRVVLAAPLSPEVPHNGKHVLK